MIFCLCHIANKEIIHRWDNDLLCDSANKEIIHCRKTSYIFFWVQSYILSWIRKCPQSFEMDVPKV